MPMEWEDPVQGATEFVKPSQLAGHLLIVAPIGYIEGIATKFGVSDAISCDVVDLDTMGDDGVQGKLYRTVNFMQGRMIQSLRPKIGKFVLGRIGQEPSKSGMNPAWVLVTASGDPEARARADAWEQAHPEYKPTEFVVREPRAQQQQVQQPPMFQQPHVSTPQQAGYYYQQQAQQAPRPPQRPDYGPDPDYGQGPMGYPPAVAEQYRHQAAPGYQPPPPNYPAPQQQQQPYQPTAVPPQYMPPPQNGQVGVAEASVLDRLRRQQEAGLQHIQGAQGQVAQVSDERQQYGY